MSLQNYKKKLLKEFCKIGKNVKIGIFGLMLAYISVSRHNISESKKTLGLLAQGICPPSFVAIHSATFSVHR